MPWEKGQIPWIKGKTKETEPKLVEAARKSSISHKGVQAGERHPMYGKHHTEEAKMKMSLAKLGINRSREARDAVAQGHKGKTLSPDTKRKISIAQIGKPRGKKTEEVKKKHRQAGYRLWQDSKYVSKVMASRHIKPNKPEQKLIDILAYFFPNEWQYVGDGKVVLNGLIPDFINKNGKKAIIEVFGDVFHDPKKAIAPVNWNRTELGRIMAYNSLGFKTLVIWEHEINNLTDGELANKIKQFIEVG